MNLNELMQNGINGILKTAGRFYLANPKGRAFLSRMAPQMLKSANLREKQEKAGRHIPPFLIASIASQCNLHCAGCYARAGGGCGESAAGGDLTDAQWGNVFAQAADLGVSFILLAGGEPLTRRGVIDRAAKCGSMIFPIFTNGTLFDEDYVGLFDANRHLIPVLSLEGDAAQTDARRGAGVFAQIRQAMDTLEERHILFGVSVTVTRGNMQAVLDPTFVRELRDRGCGVLFYVEYVPVEKDTEHLALGEEDLLRMERSTQELKDQFTDLVLLSFPGDEAAMGGCLASGRGFFHINAKGGAEPCPFSPYAQVNLREATMADVLDSPYFRELREIAADQTPHTGGCVLFERENAVRALWTQQG